MTFALTILNVVTRKMYKEDERLYDMKQPVDGIYSNLDISYDKHQKMDHYRPKNISCCSPVYIVDVHGGAWVYGDKKLNRHFCQHLSQQGFHVFNINYDLLPKATLKQQVQQICKALQYIHEHEVEYGIENYSVCLCGDSAGAHLVSLVACICRDEDLKHLYEVDIELPKIKALLLQHGIYDLKPMKKSHMYHMHKLFDWMYAKEDRKALQDKDCLFCFLDESWDIPMFLLSSEKDRRFQSQTRLLVKRLDDLHVPYELLFWNAQYELDHVFHISHPDYPESQQSIVRMATFLKQMIK